ncbi:MAG: hypothetical protein MZW92_09510 [Comamonadaceae bacterium]|nr:hypothetical protein [Comamonadaceae bacterium]
MSYTPLRVDVRIDVRGGGQRLLWQLRDLPTAVEVRSAALTRGLPLMKTEVVVRVLQRGGPIDAGRRQRCRPPGDLRRRGSTAPRLAPSACRIGGDAMTIRRTHLTLALAALAAAAALQRLVLRPQAVRGGGAAPGRRAAAARGGGCASGRRGLARDPLSIPAPPPVDLTSEPSWRRDPFLFGDETRDVARPVAQAQAPVLPTGAHDSLLGQPPPRDRERAHRRRRGRGRGLHGRRHRERRRGVRGAIGRSPSRARPRDGIRLKRSRADAAAAAAGRVDGNDAMRLTVRLCSMFS